MRITTVRILVQIFFISLFLFFCFVTEFSYLKGYPVSLFLEADPLVAVATAIATHTLYKGLLWSLVLLVPTALLGRFFCNWICPYGIMHQFFGWLFNNRNVQQRIDSNRYRPIFQFKYFVLIFCLVTAGLGSLQIGLLDPICLLYRSFTAALLPAFDMPTNLVYVQAKEHHGAWLIGLIIFVLVSMNLVIPRFFCRVLCPLGAFLGTISRFALWRIDRDPQKCTDCDLCLKSCEGASDPHTLLRKSECFVCFNCIEDCPHDALSFKLLPREETGIKSPDISGRRAAFAAVTAALFYPFSRLSGSTNNKMFNRNVIRPPGSVEESEFLERCIKCDQCIRVCPTNVLQPAFFQAGVEGFWTPIMDMRAGYCELNCTLCGQVCPTGAIQRIGMEEKLGIGEFKEQGPVKVGTAFYDRGRCLPWAMETPCVVCEEVCPVSPKAISTYDEVITRLDGKKVTLNKPFIIPERCIGCGICEKECPVLDERAVYVTAVGETRFRNQSDRRLLLNDKEQKASIFNIDDTGRVQLNSSILSTPNVSSLKPRVPTANTPDNKRLSLSHMIMTLGALAQKSGCGSCSSGGCSSGGCGSSNKQIKPAPASSCGSAATSNSSCASKSSCGSKSSTSNSCCSNKSESKTRAPKALSTDENFNLVTWVRQLNNNQSPKSPRS
jgi:polyferredoxin